MKVAFAAAVLAVLAVASCVAYSKTRSAQGGEVGSQRHAPVVASQESSRSVHSLGRLEPTGTVLKIAPPGGNEGDALGALHVREGDRVTKGTLLGTMDTHSCRLAAVEQERARVKTAQARLLQIRAGNKEGDIAAARAVVTSAEHEVLMRARERERHEQLHENNAVSVPNLDSARLAHDRALAVLEQSKSQLSAISEVRSVDVAVAEAELQQAQAALAVATSNLDASRILAPSDGTILKIHTHPGERVSSYGILEMGQIDRMQAVAEVFEGDLPLIAVGNSAAVTLDTTGHCVRGTVCEIGYIVARKTTLTNDPVSDTDARVVEVRIDLADIAPQWLSRLSNARIQVRIRTTPDGGHDAPAVPAASVSGRNE